MTSLPSGLASISARLDDTPQVRGAVAFGRMVGERTDAARSAEEAKALGLTSAADHIWRPTTSLTSAIDRHAALAIGSAIRAQDRR